MGSMWVRESATPRLWSFVERVCTSLEGSPLWLFFFWHWELNPWVLNHWATSLVPF